MDTFALGCLSAAIGAGLFGLMVVMPIVNWTRQRRAFALIEALRVRVAELESQLAAPPVPTRVAAAAKEPAAVPPAEPAAPRLEPVHVEEGAARVEPAGRADTLETRIGGRGLLYIGMAALLIGVAFFVKYAFDNEWITETARVAMGTVLGLAMAAGGYRIARRGYFLYGQVVAGGGFVALYISIWAALNLYGLVSRPVAFVLMVIVTSGAAVLADRFPAQALALVAVLGGFATPLLVGSSADAQVTLFTYAAILVAGTALVAGRHGWRRLNLVSYVLTLFLATGWASAHYGPSKYAASQFFLVLFAAMFGWVFLRERRAHDPSTDPLPTLALGSVPLLFHGLSVVNLEAHSLPLLIYLTLFTLGGVLASVRWDKAWIRLVIFIAATPPLMGWLAAHQTPGWRTAAVAVLLAQYLMYLSAQGERASREPDAWDKSDVVLFHANALALFGGLFSVVDAFWPYATSSLPMALAVWQGALAWALRRVSGEAAVHALAATFAMLGFAIGLQFDDWWELVGWAVEAGAIYWAGLKTGRAWMRRGGMALLAVVVAGLFDAGFFGTPAGFVAVMNARAGATLAIVAVAYAMSYFLRRRLGAEGAGSSGEYAALLVGANLLTLLLISVEIGSYWHLRQGDDATANFARLASWSVAWGLYGTGLLIVGIQRRYAPLRYLGIALLLVTVAKVFLVDLSELGGIYRIVGFMGLGVCLLLGAWLYQRYRDVILGDLGRGTWGVGLGAWDKG